MEVIDPNSSIMQLRWTLPTTSGRYQEVLDIILSFISNRTKGNKDGAILNNEYMISISTISDKITQELDDILFTLSQRNNLIDSNELNFTLDDFDMLLERKMENLNLSGAKGISKYQHHDNNQIATLATTLMSNLTFNIILLVELAKYYPGGTELIFIRLLRLLGSIPQSRLAVVIYALKDVSTRYKFDS
jgi:hypothetical protein